MQNEQPKVHNEKWKINIVTEKSPSRIIQYSIGVAYPPPFSYTSRADNSRTGIARVDAFFIICDF